MSKSYSPIEWTEENRKLVARNNMLYPEAQEKCSYCHGDLSGANLLPASVWGHDVIALANLDGNYVICADLKDPHQDRWITQYTISIKFCPMCGRKL